ncbi:SDR family NAD(P)-dependent oxidoreductase [Hirschia litorea]|uniref:SDR family NAD(P)-dependent oxidoreductase n=1 Tax=Hirschia litorea TaxID=1199156 RepID=A0ABW2INY7_9PROT
MPASLENQIAIVTGGADGIGRAIVELFCKQGAKVCVADVNESFGEALVVQLREKGHEAVFAKTDIVSSESVAAMVKKTVETLGEPTILINNAGVIWENKDLLETTQAQWNKSFGVNVEGMWNCAREVLPYMKKARGGSIVNVGSVHGFKIVRGHFPYAVTKHAVNGLTKNLAVEYGDYNIRVNALVPGMIETPNAFKWWDSMPDPVAGRKAIADLHPLRRNGSLEEIAYPALFLAGPESSFMTGQSLIVDGGRTCVYHD